MSWKRDDSKKPSKEDGENNKEKSMDSSEPDTTANDAEHAVADILEVDDTEFLDEEELLLQTGAEDDDIDECTNDDLLEGDVSGEFRSVRQKEASEGADVGRCKSNALPATVQELPVSPGQVDKEKAKIGQGQADGSGKTERAKYCEDKSSATQSLGRQRPKSGDSVAASTYAEPAGRKQNTSSKKMSALESSSVLATSGQPGKSSHTNAHRFLSDKGKTSGDAARDVSSSRSGTASRGGRSSKRTDRPDRAARGSNGIQQSRCDSRLAPRRRYSRGHSAPRAKQPRMQPYAARPSIGLLPPSRPSFGNSQPYRPASSGPPHAEQPCMPYGARPPFGTSPPNRPAASYDLSQANNVQDLLHGVSASFCGPKRTSAMPAIETRSLFVGPVLASTGLSSCSPGLAASGASQQPPLPHQRWPLPGDRAGVQSSSFEAPSLQLGDSMGATVRRRAATDDGGTSLPNFGPQRQSRISNEATEQPAFLGNNDLSQLRVPFCEPRYEMEQPSSEALQESASKGRFGHNETFKDFFSASSNFSSDGSLHYTAHAPRDVDVPTMHIDYNHGNGDCDYRIPEHLRKMAVAIGVGRPADLAKSSGREEWTPARLDEQARDFACDGNTSDCRRLERGDTVHAGSKRHNPSNTSARSTMSATLSFDDSGSTYDDVKRARIVGSNCATLQPAASGAARDVATDQSPARVARFLKNSTSNQASSVTESFGKSPNSDEYNKRLQEQSELRKEIMRRKEEQRKQEAERIRIEMEKSRENDASLTPCGAGRRKSNASKAEEMPRRSASSSQSLLPAGLAERPFRVPTLEVSANVDGTAGAAGSTAATVASGVARKGSSLDSLSGAKAIRQPVTAVGTASSGNILLRERYRQLRLVAALPTSSAPKSPHLVSSFGALSDADSARTAAAPRSPHLVSSIRTLSDAGSAGRATAPKAPHLVSSNGTLSVGGSAGSATASKSPSLVRGVRTLADGGNAGSAAALRASRILPGNRRQFGIGEAVSPGCESATFGPTAGHLREDLQAWPQPQRSQQQERHTLAVGSRSPNQSGRLLVDYDGGSTENRYAGLPSRRSRKVSIRNLSRPAHLQLFLNAAMCGKVVHARFDDTGIAIVEFDSAAAAELFFNRYNNSVIDNAKISVNIEMS